MRKIKFVTIILICFTSISLAQVSPYLEKTQKLDLLTLHITTDNGQLPTGTAIYPPKDCWGRGLANAEKLTGELTVSRLNETLYNSGPYVKGESGITIKVRGNTSGSSLDEKKPYKIKLQKKEDLLFRGNKKYKDKNWALIDINELKTYVGFMINKYIGMDWVPEHQYAFVYINGEFRGLYLLIEIIDRNTDCRVDISKNGFLWEHDAYWWNENLYIPTTRQHLNYTIKYPDEEDLTPEQKDYLSEQVAMLERQIYTKDGITENIDVKTFARWLMAHDILGTTDFAGSNIYFAKYDDTDQSPISMICNWDFDSSLLMETISSWSSIHFNVNFWFKSCFSLPQKQFVKEYIDLYDTKVDNVINTTVDSLKNLSNNTTFVNTINEAIDLNTERWYKQVSDFKTQISSAVTYLEKKQDWMKVAIETEIRPLLNEGTTKSTLQKTEIKDNEDNESSIFYIYWTNGYVSAITCNKFDSITACTSVVNQDLDSLTFHLINNNSFGCYINEIDSITFIPPLNRDWVFDDCGNKYPLVTVGSQCWMAENLKCHIYSINSERGEKAGATKVELGTAEILTFNPYYVDARLYKKSPETDLLDNTMREKLGYLYNWSAAVGIADGEEARMFTEGFTDYVQGICPDNFHIPTVQDWEILRDNIGEYNTSGARLRTKEGWFEGSAFTKGLNDCGFNMFPSGYARGASIIEHLGEGAYFWTSDIFFEDMAYERYLLYNTAKLGEYHAKKYDAQSVRCVRNY